MASWLSQRAYAKHRGARGLRGSTHPAVSRAIRDGRITSAVRADGKIHAERADTLWPAQEGEPYRGQPRGPKPPGWHHRARLLLRALGDADPESPEGRLLTTVWLALENPEGLPAGPSPRPDAQQLPRGPARDEGESEGSAAESPNVSRGTVQAVEAQLGPSRPPLRVTLEMDATGAPRSLTLSQGEAFALVLPGAALPEVRRALWALEEALGPKADTPAPREAGWRK